MTVHSPSVMIEKFRTHCVRTPMKPTTFNDLAVIVIYHFADVCYEKQAQKAARRLKRQGLIAGIDDAESAYEQYEQAVIEYAQEHLPSDYTFQYDYWGAKCFSNQKGWSSPKTGFFSGDSGGRIMFFSEYAAMEQYTAKKCELIDTLEEYSEISTS